DLVAILEPSGFLRYLNNAGYRLVNLDAGTDVSTLCLSNLFPERMAQRLKIEALPAARKNGTWSGETALQRADGLEIPVSQVMLAHYDKAGDVQYLSTIVRDITERKRFEAELHHQATHDTLTQLPNRFLLADRLTTEIERMRRRNGLAAVFFLDIDNFKRINDSLGHRRGDHLLQRIAERLCTTLRPNDTVARYDGDEFSILAGDLPHVDSVLVILGKIRAAFERPVSIDAQDAYVSFSIGIAVYPHDGVHVDELLRNAGTAMYRAKSAGPNQYRLYTPEMNARSHERLTLESELRHAYKHNEFILHYQPQLTLANRKITAAEGLIRWQHPQRGLVSPADFVPLLEETGLIIPVGEWVLRQACRDFRETGLQDLRVSVNVSVAQFNDADLLDKIQRALKEECVPPKAVELEITENLLIKDPAATREILEALHALGVRIAIDDFGTGYSSLAYLKRLPLDVLKIDQSFIRDLSHDAGDAAIVEASISLGKKLGMEVIAEGVETKNQFDLLHKLDCDMVQGYYISRPLPKTQFSDLLKNKPSW
ncbi:MAG: EAL domain-containing protein, partial [Methylovulum sp.]